MGRVGEARNELGSAALTIFFSIGFGKDGTVVGTVVLAEMYSSLSLFLLWFVTRLDIVGHETRGSEVAQTAKKGS